MYTITYQTETNKIKRKKESTFQKLEKVIRRELSSGSTITKIKKLSR